MLEIPIIDEITEQRFWQKVKKQNDGCWLWRAYQNRWGYGVFAIKRKTYLAHRIAYSLLRGSIPEASLVCHKCDVPLCVNPDHLFLGTDATNAQDSIHKGRKADCAGMANGNAHLTREQVYEIRQAYDGGQTTILQLAERFPVSKSQIWNIVSKAQWAGMESDPGALW